MNSVTINTDASFNHQGNFGGFAFWIASDQGRIVRKGPLKSVRSSNEAELQCIANALHTLLQSGLSHIDYIYINSDAKTVFEWVSSKAKKGTAEYVCFKILLQLKEKYGLKDDKFFEFRHVKAHLHKKTKRHYVNDWCDKMAKAEMKKLKFHQSQK